MGYWEGRQAQMMYEYMEDAEAVSRELADLYAKASRHLNHEIEKVYEKFKDKHLLSDGEARRLLNTLRDKTDLEELKRALAMDPKNRGLLAEIEGGAYRARIERMGQLQAEIDLMMGRIYEQEKTVATAHYKDLAVNSYYREVYNVQHQAGFQFSFSAVDPKAVAKVLGSKWSGADYSARIWNNTHELAKDAKEQLILGMLTGKSQEEMAREVAKKYATGAFEARRLVRTESNFVSGQMQLAAYEECGAEQYEFVAVLDLRTSVKCRELDGKVFYVKDARPGVNMNPMHPFCRSTTIIHIDGMVAEGLKRRARDPETGEEGLVPADMDYEQWYEKNVASNPKAVAAEKMVKNRSPDKKQYEEYKEIIGKEAGRSLDEFQEMKYNDCEKWEYTKGLKEYLKKYPTSDKRYYDAGKELECLGIAKGVILPPVRKRAFILPEGNRDPYHIMHRMAERHMTDDEIRSYMDHADAMAVQWGGRRQVFYGNDGVCVITRSGEQWVYKTAWKKEDFDENTEKILGVIKNHVS